MKLIGKIKEAHGLKGEMYVLVFSGDVSFLPKLKSFGVGELPERGTDPAPSAVRRTLACERAKPFKKGFLVKAGGVDDRNASEALEGSGVYVEAGLLRDEDEIDLEALIGFVVQSPAGERHGEIAGLSSNGAQDLLVLRTATGEAEIPFVEAFLKKIDPKKKTVVMELPEGLLDLGALDE